MKKLSGDRAPGWPPPIGPSIGLKIKTLIEPLIVLLIGYLIGLPIGSPIRLPCGCANAMYPKNAALYSTYIGHSATSVLTERFGMFVFFGAW